MSSNTQLALRYAKPVVDLAQKSNKLNELKKDAEFLLEVASENRELTRLIESPVVSSEKKLAILEQIFSNHVSALFANLLKVVSSKEREAHLLQISKTIISEYNRLHNIGEATLETAYVMEADTEASINRQVAELLGKDAMEFNVVHKPDLIGGFKVRLGDRQIDASVRGQLQELRNEFLR